MTALPKDVEALRNLSFFSELTDHDLARVASVGRRRTYDTGQVLLERDSDSGGLFVILSGSVSVEVGESTHRLGPGEFFGEMALLGGRQRSSRTGSDFFGEKASLGRARRSASVTAVEPVETLVIETIYFDAFLLENPSVAVAILHGVVERLRAAQARLEGTDS